jgi:UDP-2,3-diacylglucosamine hydrolase
LKRLYLSDLHLEDAAGPHLLTLATLLDNARVDECWFLGDLCEVWVGDDDDGALATALRELLYRASRRFRVVLMHGNRDFLFGSRFASATGIELVNDPSIRSDGVVLAHGDEFCIDDQPYQSLRALFRSHAWQGEVLSRSLAERRTLAASLRAQSRAANALKPQGIMDVNEAAIADAMRQHQADILVHGHTHRPGSHRHTWGSRHVLGDWGRVAWALWEPVPREFRLECLPLERRATVKAKLGIR